MHDYHYANDSHDDAQNKNELKNATIAFTTLIDYYLHISQLKQYKGDNARLNLIKYIYCKNFIKQKFSEIFDIILYFWTRLQRVINKIGSILGHFW